MALKLSVIGTGYLGATHAACMASLGFEVIGFDTEASKIALLSKGKVPFYEPELEELLSDQIKSGRLTFTNNVADLANADVHFICVGTPQIKNGNAADLTYVNSALESIAKYVKPGGLVVGKSTVPVGTATKLRNRLLELNPKADLAWNPEFLREGSAVADGLKPDRIIVGTDDERAILLMRALYMPFMRNHDRMQVMDARSAEFTKYAANAMLATRISFMNELARLAEKTGADIEMVRRGIGSDPRIGTHFLYPGTGYGGSCFPKDVKALIHAAGEHGVTLGVLQAVEAANERQKHVLVDKIVARFGDDLTGRTFALWGLAFKPNTDDMREAPALAILPPLLDRGAHVRAHDPKGVPEARSLLPNAVEYVADPYAALDGADALVLMTEWNEYRGLDLDEVLRRMAGRVVVDLRNVYDPAVMAARGFDYHCVGRSDVAA